MPTKIIPISGSFEKRPAMISGNERLAYIVRHEIPEQYVQAHVNSDDSKAKAQAAAEAQLITVPTQGDLDTALADLSQRLDARLTTVENMQANLASKHTEIIAEIQKLPESVKIQLIKEAFGEWVTELVRAEVSKATSM